MSNSKKTNEKSVTIADLILMLALAIYAVFTYFGESIFAQSIPVCILMVSIRMILMVFILFALFKVKQVKNDFTKWQVVEYSLLLVFVFFSMSSIRKDGVKFSPIVNALSSTFQRNDLIEKGQSDIEKVRSLFNEYESFEESAIGNTTASLARIKDNSSISRKADTLIIHTRGHKAAAIYGLELKGKFLGNDYQEFHNRVDKDLSRLEDDLGAWNLMRISSFFRELSKISETVSNKLTSFSKLHQPETDYPFKYMLLYIDGTFYIDSAKQSELERVYNKPELVFQKALMESHSNAAVFLSIIIVLLLLVVYFAAPRSSTVAIGRGNSKHQKTLDGGISLYD